MKLALAVAALALAASCGPLELAGEAAVGATQVGLGAAQAAVGVVDRAI